MSATETRDRLRLFIEALPISEDIAVQALADVAALAALPDDGRAYVMTQNPDVPWRDETMHLGAALPDDGREDDALAADIERFTGMPKWKGYVAPALPDDGRERLDVKRLARAMGSTGNCGHSSCPRDTSRHDDEASEVAREYAALVSADKP